MNKKIIYTFFASVLFLGTLSALTMSGSITLNNVDTYIDNLLRAHIPTQLYELSALLTKLFNKEIFLMWFAVLILILIFYKRITYTALLLFGTMGGQAVKSVLKDFIAKPRPEHLPNIDVHGSSFPSGHATTSVFIALCIIFLFSPLVSKQYRLPLQIVGWFIAFTIPLSRIILHVHYITDILAGAALGVASFTFSVILFKYIVNTIYTREYDKLPDLLK